jgi:hypothetical protein
MDNVLFRFQCSACGSDRFSFFFSINRTLSRRGCTVIIHGASLTSSDHGSGTIELLCTRSPGNTRCHDNKRISIDLILLFDSDAIKTKLKSFLGATRLLTNTQWHAIFWDDVDGRKVSVFIGLWAGTIIGKRLDLKVRVLHSATRTQDESSLSDFRCTIIML